MVHLYCVGLKGVSATYVVRVFNLAGAEVEQDTDVFRVHQCRSAKRETECQYCVLFCFVLFFTLDFAMQGP